MRGFAVVVIALLVAVVIAVTTFAIRWVTAPAKGKLDAREQIHSGGNRIQAYDHFFNLCAAVQTDEVALDAQLDQLAGASSDDERDRIRANIAGVTADRAGAINEYNADARKDYTVGQFRASKLPYDLPTTSYTKGDRTSCGT